MKFLFDSHSHVHEKMLVTTDAPPYRNRFTLNLDTMNSFYFLRKADPWPDLVEYFSLGELTKLFQPIV